MTSTALTTRDHPWSFSQKARPGERTAQKLGEAFCEGYLTATNAFATRLSEGAPVNAWELASRLFPLHYAMIRDYLIGDCDVDERIAQKIALRLEARYRR